MSENQAENDSESSLPTFRPFTREELAVIENRITEKKLAAKKKAERRARNIAVTKSVFDTWHYAILSIFRSLATLLAPASFMSRILTMMMMRRLSPIRNWSKVLKFEIHLGKPF